MSKLHNWVLKHKGMSDEQKYKCDCGLCTKTNVYNRRNSNKFKVGA